VTEETIQPSPNLFQRLNAIQAEVGYVQKDTKVSTGGGSYSAISHDAVTAMLRPHLVKHGVIISTSLNGDPVLDPAADGAKQRLFRAEFVVSFINIDNPEDRHAVIVPAFSMDTGDKHCGKAISMATKYAMLKVFALETGDAEESRVASGDYNFSAALELAESGDKAVARAALEEAQHMALKLKDADAAKAIAIVRKRIVEKFKRLEAGVAE
jgi:hypothetical protein